MNPESRDQIENCTLGFQPLLKHFHVSAAPCGLNWCYCIIMTEVNTVVEFALGHINSAKQKINKHWDVLIKMHQGQPCSSHAFPFLCTEKQ